MKREQEKVKREEPGWYGVREEPEEVWREEKEKL